MLHMSGGLECVDHSFAHVAHFVTLREVWIQWWANLDQAPEDLDKNIFRDLSPTPKP